MHAAKVAGMAAIAATIRLGRGFEDQDARARFRGGDRGAKGCVAAADHDYVPRSVNGSCAHGNSLMLVRVDGAFAAPQRLQPDAVGGFDMGAHQRLGLNTVAVFERLKEGRVFGHGLLRSVRF